MRLLGHSETGELDICSFDNAAIPPYAILFTWGEEAEEVAFEDVVYNAAQGKSGYEQAKRDRLHCFWIDACCINKANKAEHSLAIQSVFHWYRDAAQCYVYLSDVAGPTWGSNIQEEASQPLWNSAFRQSDLFTRGWTLRFKLPDHKSASSCDQTAGLDLSEVIAW
jgi:hypothetical protein